MLGNEKMVKRKRPRKNEIKKFFDALSPKLSESELSTDKGRPIYQKYKLSKKTKRGSGRYTPNLAGTIPNSEKNDIDMLIELPSLQYDEWISYSDGLRDVRFVRKPYIFYYGEERLRAEQINKKVKKEIAIRKAQKVKRELERNSNLT